jgi:hypothetical protein
MNDLPVSRVFVKVDEETVEEYAARWAAMFFDASGTADLKDVAWEWAKSDERSPVAAAISAGAPDEVVAARFDESFAGMRAVLVKFSETPRDPIV